MSGHLMIYSKTKMFTIQTCLDLVTIDKYFKPEQTSNLVIQ